MAIALGYSLLTKLIYVFVIPEHKGVNNRLLRELGWIQVKGNRDSPRNCESRLASREKLDKRRRDLLHLMKEPRSFIAFVFNDNSSEWVDRCLSIIQDR